MAGKGEGGGKGGRGRRRQGRIPETESPKNKKVREAAEAYLQDKSDHKELTTTLTASKQVLIAAMKKAGLESYVEGDLVVTLTAGEDKISARRTEVSAE